MPIRRTASKKSKEKKLAKAQASKSESKTSKKSSKFDPNNVQVGDIVQMTGIMAVVVEVLNENQTKKQRCWIKQEGEKYCVFCSDLKPYEGD